MNFMQASQSKRPELELACTCAYDGFDHSDYIDRCTECGVISISNKEYKEIAVTMYQFQMKRYNETSVNKKYHLDEQ